MFKKKPFLYAGISGVLAIVISIFFTIAGMFIFPEFFSIINSAFYLVFSIYFIYGFYYLGLKYKDKFLSIVSCAGIFLILIVSLGLLIFNGPISRDAEQFNITYSQQQIVLDNLNATNASAAQIAVLEEKMAGALFDFITPYLIAFLVIFIFWVIAFILFNVALIRLKKVNYAKITGIIGLVSIGLTITIIGIFLAIPLMIAYYVMLIIILFNEAKKFKEYR